MGEQPNYVMDPADERAIREQLENAERDCETYLAELARLRTQLATAERALVNLSAFCESLRYTEMGLLWINEPKAITEARDALDAIRKGAG